MTSGQLSYDLRRLRYNGFIQRIPRTHRYQVTGTGLRDALFFTRACGRFLHDGLAELARPLPTPPPKLRAAARAYETAIDDLLTRAGLAA
jgi:hypothetical protein